MKWKQTVASANWNIVVLCGHQRFSELSVAFPLCKDLQVSFQNYSIRVVKHSI